MKKINLLLPILGAFALVGCSVNKDSGNTKPGDTTKPDSGETTPGGDTTKPDGGETTPGGGDTGGDTGGEVETPTTLTYEEFESEIVSTLSSMKDSSAPYGIRGASKLQTSNMGSVDETTNYKLTTFDKTEGTVFIGDGMLKYDSNYVYGQHYKYLDKNDNQLSSTKLDLTVTETLYEKVVDGKGYGRYIGSGTDSTKYDPENAEEGLTNETLEISEDFVIKGDSPDFDIFAVNDTTSTLFTLTDTILNSLLDFTSTDETYVFEYKIEEVSGVTTFTASYSNTTTYEPEQTSFSDKYTITATIENGYFASYSELDDLIITYEDGSKYREKKEVLNELIPYEAITYPTDETNATVTTNFEDLFTYGILNIGFTVEE